MHVRSTSNARERRPSSMSSLARLKRVGYAGMAASTGSPSGAVSAPSRADNADSSHPRHLPWRPGRLPARRRDVAVTGGARRGMEGFGGGRAVVESADGEGGGELFGSGVPVDL
ncbi:hypothetical protein M427DRAFT_174679 [Gonapodya prolifera JEL478]|uniref:Uncharacterized protein n=1 Tax=Gonapodya prolifera (strain JEL478) TaxID=1344416 RepID=A0A139B0P2_GONPJ|nr:hypothetical protein M427DRAFT_174679 [Gonapodya prolifera JEL478]|eukprot:KXS22537.1 hypothetical protein M427DRAFT_174679 [Gonapodya prolifera JEL478]